jgi:hypothetical protein
LASNPRSIFDAGSRPEDGASESNHDADATVQFEKPTHPGVLFNHPYTATHEEYMQRVRKERRTTEGGKRATLAPGLLRDQRSVAGHRGSL